MRGDGALLPHARSLSRESEEEGLSHLQRTFAKPAARRTVAAAANAAKLGVPRLDHVPGHRRLGGSADGIQRVGTAVSHTWN